MKQLAELLVLSKLDYCYCLYGALLDYLVKRLQKVQNTAASFVLGKFTKVNGVITLGQFPIKERIDYSIGKRAYQALNDDKWPRYLSLKVKQGARVLRSNSGGLKLEHSKIQDSFQYNAANVFNNLPEHIKLMDFKNFKINFKNILLAQAKLRNL